jgi:hypothetical protein
MGLEADMAHFKVLSDIFQEKNREIYRKPQSGSRYESDSFRIQDYSDTTYYTYLICIYIFKCSLQEQCKIDHLYSY